MRTQLLRLVAAVALSSMPLSAQLTQTLPRGFDTMEGNSYTAFPFHSRSTQKWHWVYDSAQFDAAGPIWISRIDIRPDGSVGSWGSRTYQNFEMRLGASRNHYSVGSYEPVFDANWAPEARSPHAFFRGPLRVPAGARPGAAPNPWSISVSGTPFRYDPREGRDFIIEIRTPGASGGNPLLHLADVRSGTRSSNGGNRYGDTSNASATAWTSSGDEFVPIVRIHYTPVPGLHADFSMSPGWGPSPLVVQFRDMSYTSDPNGIKTWAWYFDGDSIVDSNERHPSFTYRRCGMYCVSLTVTDTQHPASGHACCDCIVVGSVFGLDASFTWVPAALPSTIQFTDTSRGSPTTWAWDFDGDNAVDSTLQNPLWSYARGGFYEVTLTAGSSCGSSSWRSTIYVVQNDECTRAITLALGPSIYYSNLGATTSAVWPCGSGGKDVWFSYRTPCAGTLEVNTCAGLSFDPVLEALGGTCGALTTIACNNDSCGLGSRIAFGVQAATTYYIRVGGVAGVEGGFQLDLVLRSSGAGAFANVFPGCGGSTLSTTGTPNLGTRIGFDLSWSGGHLPLLFLGTVPVGATLCPEGCVLGTNFDVVRATWSFSTVVPCFNFLRGSQVYIQGAEIGVSGGCASEFPVQLVTSNTVRATIG